MSSAVGIDVSAVLNGVEQSLLENLFGRVVGEVDSEEASVRNWQRVLGSALEVLNAVLPAQSLEIHGKPRATPDELEVLRALLLSECLEYVPELLDNRRSL